MKPGGAGKRGLFSGSDPISKNIPAKRFSETNAGSKRVTSITRWAGRPSADADGEMIWNHDSDFFRITPGVEEGCPPTTSPRFAHKKLLPKSDNICMPTRGRHTLKQIIAGLQECLSPEFILLNQPCLLRQDLPLYVKKYVKIDR